MKILKTSVVVFITIFLWSCDNFLAESSQDEVRPSTVQDMEQLAKGELYFGTGYWNDYFNITKYMTDDVQNNGVDDGIKYPYKQTTTDKFRWMFTWDPDMYTKQGGGADVTVPYLWERPYQRIKGCNVILEYLDNVIGDDYLRETLRGEAYAMRAYYYFNMVNLLGEPYNFGDPKTNLGVPLKLRSAVTDEQFKRNTVAEVYDQIESDWLKAANLMKTYPTKQPDIYRMSRAGVLAMLSRLYLYQEKWDKTITYADSVMMLKPELINLSSFTLPPTLGAVTDKTPGVYSAKTPTEILWACRTKDTSNESGGVTVFPVSEDLMQLYALDYNNPTNKGDLRAVFYMRYASYLNNGPTVLPIYVSKDLGNYNDVNTGIRNVEALLNRAEAYIHKFIATGQDDFRVKALADINFLRKNRMDTRNVPYFNIDITNPQELFDFYKKERRRELCGEGFHRWFDLRRYGKPELKHEFRQLITDAPQTFTLPKGSPRYVLQIPEVIIENNPKLEQNPF